MLTVINTHLSYILALDRAQAVTVPIFMYMQVEHGDGERTAEVGKGLAPGIVCELIWCRVAWSLLVTDAAGYSEL